jgi:hypothetical protein
LKASDKSGVNAEAGKGENPMKKYMKWIVLGLILAFTIGIEVYKGEEGKLPWAFLFAAIVVFFVYNFWKAKDKEK